MSGGIDSAACAHHLRSQGFNVDGIFLDYGQPAAGMEAKAAKIMAHHLGVSFREITLLGSDLSGVGEIVGRNAFLIFSALFLTRGKSSFIGLGLHAGTPYYDCSEAFVSSISKLVAEHTDGRVSIIMPFIKWNKADVYKYFVSAALPITATYSCEAGTQPVCGVCASCRDRKALGC